MHCGFCTATCPTYQLLGDELDGPRGRIYLMKQVFEGQPVSESTRLHRPLPDLPQLRVDLSVGVRYGRRSISGARWSNNGWPPPALRPAGERALRWVLREGLTRPALFGSALRLGR